MDFVADLKHGLGYDFFKPSTNPDPEERQEEDRDTIQNATSMYAGLENKMHTHDNQGLYDAYTHVFSMGLHQDRWIPFYYVMDGLDFSSHHREDLIDHCTSDDDRRKALWFQGLPPVLKGSLADPVNRRLKRYMGSRNFQKRCIPTIDLSTFFASRGVLILSGQDITTDDEKKKSLSREDKRTIFKMVLLYVFLLAQRGAFPHGLRIIVDEGLDGGIIDEHFAQAARELAKWKIQLVVIIQDPLVLAPAIHSPLMTNFEWKLVFKQPNPQAAKFFAESLGIPTMDLNEEKSRETTTRTINKGYEEIPTETKTVSEVNGERRTSVSKGTTFRPIQEQIDEEHIKTFTSDEQLIKVAQWLMTQKVGEYGIISPSYFSKKPEYKPMLPMPYDGLFHPGPPRIPLAEYLLYEALQKCYQTDPSYTLRFIPWPSSPSNNKPNNGQKSNGKPQNKNGQKSTTTKSGKNGDKKRFKL